MDFFYFRRLIKLGVDLKKFTLLFRNFCKIFRKSDLLKKFNQILIKLYKNKICTQIINFKTKFFANGGGVGWGGGLNVSLKSISFREENIFRGCYVHKNLRITWILHKFSF